MSLRWNDIGSSRVASMSSNKGFKNHGEIIPAMEYRSNCTRRNGPVFDFQYRIKTNVVPEKKQENLPTF